MGSKPSAELRLLNEGSMYHESEESLYTVQVTQRATIIGRDAKRADIRLDGLPSISNIHCTILYEADEDQYYLIDNNSRNGTRINNHRITTGHWVRLQDNDLIELGTPLIGGALLRFYILDTTPPADTSTLAEIGSIGQNTVFISYSRQDLAIMERLSDELRNTRFLKNIEVWTDETLQKGTPSWQQEIEKALNRADAVIMLMSPDAKKSEWVEREITFAQNRNKTFFPVLVRGTDADAVPISLVNMQWFDVREDAYNNGILDLIGGLVKHLQRINQGKQ